MEGAATPETPAAPVTTVAAPAPAAPRLGVVVWELTLACNLACRLCGSRAGPARGRELTTDEALAVVAQLAEVGVAEVTLSGGEAYLRPDFDTIAAALAARGIYVSMVTAGRAFDAALARRAAAAGIQHVSVSIDGLAATHDDLRGVRGAFDSAIAALRNIRAAGMVASTNTQINRRTAPELEPLLEILAREEVNAWRVQLTTAGGRAADRPDLLLQPYELLDLFPLLARVKAQAINLGIGFWPGNNVGYFGPYETFLRGDTTARGYWRSCTAGATTLGLEADGTVKGCLTLPTRAYGAAGVPAHPLRDLLDAAPPLAAIRTRTVADLWGHCRSCYYAAVCLGGCTWTGHVLLGRPGNNPYCHYRALELVRRGRRERLVPAAPAPGEPFDCGRFDLVEEPIPLEEKRDGGGER